MILYDGTMKYMGSKRRLWKDIGPIILKDRRKGQCYVEPFVGGCNSLVNVEGRRFAADVNPYLIAMLKSVLSGEPQLYPIPKELYNELRQAYYNNDFSQYSLSDIGWVGYMASFNGRFYEGGYSGKAITKEGIERDYIDEAIRTFLKDVERLRGVVFKCCSYDELIIPRNSIVYCDPPYRDTTKYAVSEFDYERFYSWCKELSEQGNKVFISEYWMPSEFKEIWSKEVKAHLNIEKKNRIEKLFTI